MGRYTVDFYEKEDGTSPVEEFLDTLDNKMKAKIFRIIDLLEENGPEVRLPHSKPLDDGIFEIRAKVGSDITRILYFFVIKGKIILTNGFVKKTQKTPKNEIELAKKYRTDYKRRNKMSRYEEYKKKALSNPEVKTEYDALGPEFDIIQAMIDARKSQNITQKELAEKTGITQANISRIENGTRNPSLEMLKRLANGMGMTLKLEFIPNVQKHGEL